MATPTKSDTVTRDVPPAAPTESTAAAANAAEAIGRLVSARKVTGTTVFNPGGDKLGKIEDIVLDKITGQVLYAIMSFGGFLGFGDKHFPLPWHLLQHDREKTGYVVAIDKHTLAEAPSYGATEAMVWENPALRRRVDEHYRVPRPAGE